MGLLWIMAVLELRCGSFLLVARACRMGVADQTGSEPEM